MKTAETESSAAKLQSEVDDLVRVMTIHKSKGLEFPVVFVADLGKQFNEADTRAAVITHQEWGYGMDYMDLDHRASYRTLSKTALAEAIKLENLSEEMRVLYVALTRAKEKLILTGTVRNLQRSVEKWAETADSVEELSPRIPSASRKKLSGLDYAGTSATSPGKGIAGALGADRQGRSTTVFG